MYKEPGIAALHCGRGGVGGGGQVKLKSWEDFKRSRF